MFEPLKLAGFALAAGNCLWAQMDQGGDEEIGGISRLLKCSTCSNAQREAVNEISS